MTTITISPLGIQEAIETLTGFEEQEIEKRFGDQIESLLELRPTTGMRALAFVVIARDLAGQDLRDAKGKAYTSVMEMTMKQVADFWPDEEPDEVDPERPVTATGEDDSSAGA